MASPGQVAVKEEELTEDDTARSIAQEDIIAEAQDVDTTHDATQPSISSSEIAVLLAEHNAAGSPAQEKKEEDGSGSRPDDSVSSPLIDDSNLIEQTADQAQQLGYPLGCPVSYNFQFISKDDFPKSCNGVIKSVLMDPKTRKLIFKVKPMANHDMSLQLDLEESTETIHEDNIAYGYGCPILVKMGQNEMNGEVSYANPLFSENGKTIIGNPSYTIVVFLGGNQSQPISNVPATSLTYREVEKDIVDLSSQKGKKGSSAEDHEQDASSDNQSADSLVSQEDATTKTAKDEAKESETCRCEKRLHAQYLEPDELATSKRPRVSYEGKHKRERASPMRELQSLTASDEYEAEATGLPSIVNSGSEAIDSSIINDFLLVDGQPTVRRKLECCVRALQTNLKQNQLPANAYYKEHIVDILKEHLVMNVVDHKALELISRRVAASNGGVYLALQMTSRAVDICLNRLTDEERDMIVKKDGETCMPLVKLSHMMHAIREGMPIKIYDDIRGLPQAARVVLCVAISLSEVWGPTAIGISILKNYCHQAFLHGIMGEWGLENLPYLIQILVDSSLLVADEHGQFNAYDVTTKLKVTIHLDEVDIALEKNLLEEGEFYHNLVCYIKRECPHPPS